MSARQIPVVALEPGYGASGDEASSFSIKREVTVAPTNPYAGPRWLAFLMSAVAVVTLLAGVIDTPLGEWSGTNFLFGVVLVVFAVAFAVAGARGSFNLVGRLSGKASMIIAIIGALASIAVVLGSVSGGEWNVSIILTTGMWVALFLMFAGTISVANKKMKAGE